MNGKFKFLFVARDKYPPTRSDVRCLFADEMTSRGHSIDWLLQSSTPCRRSYETNWNRCNVWVGVANRGNSAWSSLYRHILGIGHSLKMFKLSANNSYDFIQVRDSLFSSLMAIVASKINHSKFIFWLSFPFPEAALYLAQNRIAHFPLYSHIRGLIAKFLLYKIILPKADHIYVQSEQMRKNVARRGIPEIKMTPVPMGVSLVEIPFNEALNECIGGGNTLVYLGALDRMRNIDFLLRVFQKVQTTLQNARLYIIGDSQNPRDIAILKEQANKMGISSAVIFTGYLPMKKAWQYVAKADVCISFINPIPIYDVGSPTKLIEYMAMGKPVVANDHPEQKVVLSESGGGLCVPADEETFKEAILSLLQDEKAALEMGVKGRRYVKNCRTYKNIADMVESEYRRILLKKD